MCLTEMFLLFLSSPNALPTWFGRMPSSVLCTSQVFVLIYSEVKNQVYYLQIRNYRQNIIPCEYLLFWFYSQSAEKIWVCVGNKTPTHPHSQNGRKPAICNSGCDNQRVHSKKQERWAPKHSACELGASSPCLTPVPHHRASSTCST